MRARTLACLLVCLPPIAMAVDPTLTVDYYPIAGTTAQALRAEMNRLGPKDDAGVRNDGNTHWNIHWRYDYDRTASCTAVNVRVNLKVRTTMPRWTPPADAPKALIATWKQFVTALQTHEDGHYKLSVEAADEVERVLRANRKDTDCERLGSRLNAAAEAVLADLRERHVRYNRETDSGRKQGTGVL